MNARPCERRLDAWTAKLSTLPVTRLLAVSQKL